MVEGLIFSRHVICELYLPEFYHFSFCHVENIVTELNRQLLLYSQSPGGAVLAASWAPLFTHEYLIKFVVVVVAFPEHFFAICLPFFIHFISSARVRSLQQYIIKYASDNNIIRAWISFLWFDGYAVRYRSRFREQCINRWLQWHAVCNTDWLSRIIHMKQTARYWLCIISIMVLILYKKRTGKWNSLINTQLSHCLRSPITHYPNHKRNNFQQIPR